MESEDLGVPVEAGGDGTDMSERKGRDDDLNRRAFTVVQKATGRYVSPKTSRAAKGGTARASNLTAEQRQAIAKKAAAARWRKSA